MKHGVPKRTKGLICGVDLGAGARLKYRPAMGVQRRLWIFSPLRDMTLVMFTPVLILLVFAAAQYGAWMDALLAFALVLAMGHYLPGMLRAYGDRSLFRRFRTRLIIAPLFLTAVTTWF